MKRILQISILLPFASLVFADHDEKGSKDLPKGSSNALVDVIIQFNLQNGSKKLQDHLKDIEDVLSKYGVQQGQNGQQGQHEDKVINSIKALHLKVPESLIPWLKANPAIRYITPNRRTTRFLDLTTVAVGAPSAWQYGVDGTGVGVAVIDSGISPKNDLTAANGTTLRVVYNESFVAGMDASDG